jgi:hypothetical protein
LVLEIVDLLPVGFNLIFKFLDLFIVVDGGSWSWLGNDNR